VFAAIRKLPSSPLLAPLEVGYQRELLVNKEKFLTGQAAGLSNGVNVPLPLAVFFLPRAGKGGWEGFGLTFSRYAPCYLMSLEGAYRRLHFALHELFNLQKSLFGHGFEPQH